MQTIANRYKSKNDFEDSTKYGDDDGIFLDLGYQSIRRVDITKYPDYVLIKKLYLSGNSLTSLPDPKLLPNLEYLVCKHNNLTAIPFYPKLTQIYASHNKIINMSTYENTQIKILDISNNINVGINYVYPYLTELFASHCSLTEFNHINYPKLRILDVNNNNLTRIPKMNQLLELDISTNKVQVLPIMDNLTHAIISSNPIESIPNLSNLIELHCSNSYIKSIPDMPKLKYLIADNNRITNIGNLKISYVIDLRNNAINHIIVPVTCEKLYITDNPIETIEIPSNTKLRTIVCDFTTLKKINFDSMTYLKPKNIVNTLNLFKLKKYSDYLIKLFDKKTANVYIEIVNELQPADFNKYIDEIINSSLKLSGRDRISEEIKLKIKDKLTIQYADSLVSYVDF